MEQAKRHAGRWLVPWYRWPQVNKKPDWVVARLFAMLVIRPLAVIKKRVLGYQVVRVEPRVRSQLIFGGTAHKKSRVCSAFFP
jgi:hypothetical protein